jgi:hypothetical protein
MRAPYVLAAAVLLAACAERSPTFSAVHSPAGPLLTSSTSHGVTLTVANTNHYTAEPLMNPPYYSFDCPVTTQYTSTLNAVVGSWVSGTVWTQDASDPFAPLEQSNLSVAQIQAALGDSVRYGTTGDAFIVPRPASTSSNDFLVRLRLRWKTDAVRVDSATVSGICAYYFGDPVDDGL